jgi:hypothetical protein
MKTIGTLAFRAIQCTTILIGASVLITIGYIIVQAITGNIHSTASFEF